MALAGSAAAFVWAAVNLPLALLAPRAWTAPARGWWGAEPGYGSLLQVPRLLADEQVAGMAALTARQGTVASLVLTLAVLVAVTVWVLACPVPPRLPVLVLVLLVGTLLAAKNVPVQASVWLLPWAALAVPSWRDHLWWWGAEAVYVVGVWQFLVGLTESRARCRPASSPRCCGPARRDGVARRAGVAAVVAPGAPTRCGATPTARTRPPGRCAGRATASS